MATVCLRSYIRKRLVFKKLYTEKMLKLCDNTLFKKLNMKKLLRSYTRLFVKLCGNSLFKKLYAKTLFKKLYTFC